jgi:hypothetical protein
MNWQQLTVRQAQQIDKIRRSIKNDETGLDVESRLLSIILNVPQSVIDSMPWGEYVSKRNSLSFIEKEIEGHPQRFIKVTGKRYRCIYDIRQMPFARYIEGKTFGQDFIGNLHKLAASMVIPQKRTLFGWKDDKYDSSKHEQYANDLLDAPYTFVYNSCVFFYQVYRNWIEVSLDYLIREGVSKGMSREQSEKSVNDLCTYLDGNLPPNLLPTSTILRYRKLMN